MAAIGHRERVRLDALVERVERGPEPAAGDVGPGLARDRLREVPVLVAHGLAPAADRRRAGQRPHLLVVSGRERAAEPSSTGPRAPTVPRMRSVSSCTCSLSRTPVALRSFAASESIASFSADPESLAGASPPAAMSTPAIATGTR